MGGGAGGGGDENGGGASSSSSSSAASSASSFTLKKGVSIQPLDVRHSGKDRSIEPVMHKSRPVP